MLSNFTVRGLAGLRYKGGPRGAAPASCNLATGNDVTVRFYLW